MAGSDWLSQTLKDLRQASGLSQSAVASRLGTSQRRVSDIERGRFVPQPDEIKTLSKLYRADTATRRRLLRSVEDMRAESVARARVVLARGAWRMQQRIARAEADSARLRHFHCSVVLGLVQTEDYARAVFSDGGDITGTDLARCVAERMKRQDILGSGRDITLLMTEGALRWQAVSPEVMAAQAERIAEVSMLPGVRAGIIPWTTPADVFPLHGFTIYDERAVTVGSLVATAFLTDPLDIAEHVRLFAGLDALADWDEGARAHLARIAAEYRALSSP